ncbi:hypothetical protein FBY31_3803 [Arthrobacter sp. SLBN-100]|uniref:hypothetical protein n=1 Tax=Arthrobacter sp. SLBN-100 TaxID=2768450 RepID=UPI00114F02AF|nr:hypothetical protein [Arthrobacter sp. SLBN-100]TQJ69647.1 hypothetical protein FBY31_3803 [Arthrobacter sp. SLBN-100]
MSVLLRRAVASASILSLGLLGPVGLSACTYDEPSPAPTTEAGTVAPLQEGVDTHAGTYLVTSFTEPFEITVPDGWHPGDGGVYSPPNDDPDHPDEGAVFVAWWPANYVATDACAWQGALVKLDPSAEAFVEAMTAQTSTASTPPVKVVVGDYSGFEFDHSVEGDVDIAACDGGKFCVHSKDAYGCSRWYSTQNERETYRVVDLNGQRAVIWVAQFRPPMNPELMREALAVFDSIVFKSDK